MEYTDPMDVSFNEPDYGRKTAMPKPTLLGGLVIRARLASDERGAQRVLLTLLVIAVLGIVLIWALAGPGTPGDIPLPPEPSSV